MIWNSSRKDNRIVHFFSSEIFTKYAKTGRTRKIFEATGKPSEMNTRPQSKKSIRKNREDYLEDIFSR